MARDFVPFLFLVGISLRESTVPLRARYRSVLRTKLYGQPLLIATRFIIR